MIRRLVFASAVLVACKGGDKQAANSEKTAEGKSGSVEGMFAGKAPMLPSEISVAKLGAPKDEALKAVGATSGYVPSKANKDITYDLDFDKTDKGELLGKVTVEAKADLEPLLTKQWGPPIRTKKGEAFWFNPEAGVRAWLPDYGKGKRVTFSSYEPIDKLLGPAGFELAFAHGKPLLGATIDELGTGWGDKLCKFKEEAPKIKAALDEVHKDSLNQFHDAPHTLRMCHGMRTTEQYTSLGDTISIGMDGKVASVTFELPTAESPEMAKQLVAMLDAKFGGKPVEVKREGGKTTERFYFDPATSLRAKVTLGEHEYIGLDYSHYLPIDTLFGDGKPTFSFEGPHMPGGTFDQIKADDPDHFQPQGVLASLVYPPTDFSSWATDVSLLYNEGVKNTDSYRFNIPFSDNEPSGDHMLELMKKKFGEPKKDPDYPSTDKDQYWMFKWNGKKVSARRVSQQWQITVSK